MATDHEKTTDAINLLNLRLTDMQNTIENEGRATRLALAQTIKDVISDEQAMDNLWSSAFSSLQRSAQDHTGRILFGGLKALASRLMLFVSLGLIVYAIGGWTALLKLWSIIWHQE
jgi:hypothetical protein